MLPLPGGSSNYEMDAWSITVWGTIAEALIVADRLTATVVRFPAQPAVWATAWPTMGQRLTLKP